MESIPAASMEVIYFALLPGKSVTIEGSLHNYKLGGDPFYESLSQLDTEIYPIMQKIDLYLQIIEEWHKKALAKKKFKRCCADE